MKLAKKIRSTRAASGRPRNPKVQRNILDAARKLIIERGYAGLTIEGIAAQSGVGKTSIYRRWHSLFALVSDVLEDANSAWPVVPPTVGHITDDLANLYRNWTAGVSGPGRVLGSGSAGLGRSGRW